MTTPVRLRLSRAKGFSLQALSLATNGLPAVNVARPSKWGNPFNWKDCPASIGQARWAKGVVVDLFRRRIAEMQANGDDCGAAELRGKNLGCWCGLDDPCHADVLLELANRPICEGIDQ